jgi:hypothetical protein
MRLGKRLLQLLQLKQRDPFKPVYRS